MKKNKIFIVILFNAMLFSGFSFGMQPQQNLMDQSKYSLRGIGTEMAKWAFAITVLP